MYHFVVNPASRSGKGRKLWTEQVEPALCKASVPYKAYFSQKIGDVSDIVCSIMANEQETPIRIIILGGDGTMNEAMQGVTDFSKVVFGYIPTGSSNDLARDLKIPKNPAAALDLILHSGEEIAMDLGCVTYEDNEKRRFCVSCGFGYDAAVCESALHSKAKQTFNKIGLGKLTYLFIALQNLISSKKVDTVLTLNGLEPVEIKKMIFSASMIHRFQGGGFMFAPDADASDGFLDICTAGDIHKLVVLCALPTAFKGKHLRFKGITLHRGESCTIEAASPLWVHTDGEVFRQSSKVTITCEKQCLHLIAPKR
jgi:YegS/Rv2252/BmrU family lipid kinase